MDARGQLRVLRNWAWVLIASVLLAGGSAYLVSSALPKTYQSTATLIVGQSLQSTNPDINQLLASQRLSQTYARIATTTSLLAKVVDKVGLNEPTDDLRKNVSVTAATDSTLITITVTDGDPQRAATIANALAGELIAASPAIAGRDASVQSFIDSDLKATAQQITDTQTELQRFLGLPSPTTDQQNQIQTLQGRLVSLRQTYATLLGSSSNSGANLLTVVDPAIPANQPSSPRVLLNAILAALMGLLFAIGIVFILEYLDDTVNSGDDVEGLLGVPTLGAIIRMKGDASRSEIYHLAALLYPRSPAAEAYRTLRTNVEFASVDHPVKTLLVTSSIPGEGKTTTAANLAVVFAQAGRRTLLLDADLRKPGAHQIFDLPNAQGLTSLLRSDEVGVAAVSQVTEQENLTVITTGPLPPNPAELLGSQRMRVILDRLSAVAELVIIDSPPLRAVTDAAILASITDGTIFVIDAGRTRRGAATSGREALAKVGARVLGVTLNRLSEKASGDYYYYDYYGGYGADGVAKDGRDVKGKGRDRGKGRGSVPPVPPSVPAGVKRE
ncbi:MAG: tyrosine-protein kinase domain-containing protein [Candidatus Limnocylindrales bacterium]